ncbi:TetR/AcrR family transcriptional regulator [Acinetobacter proteolyticus]|uniref:TetR/AcrR family transcriptional regulator n=2 Tax=Acinetobacter proteolyticus TaxID=1776741 RepID=A0A2N0WB28_9GAMM|nr:TetR/AcrR family transcriptional regulator [Acinetobacter proteolyticus]
MTNKQINSMRRGRPPRSADQITASRNTIIQAARELFAIHGYNGVSMRKIAGKANCLPATLYALFPSKRELLNQILEVVYIDLTIQLEECYKTSSESDRLENLCLVQLNFWVNRPGDYKAILLIEDTYLDFEEEYCSKKSAIFQLEIYTRVIREAQSRGKLKAGSPEEIRSILLCTILGIALSMINIPKYHLKISEKIKENAIRALIAGLKQ